MKPAGIALIIIGVVVLMTMFASTQVLRTSANDLPALSYSEDIFPVLAENCAEGDCHAGPDAWMGLDLSDAASYDLIVGQPSRQRPDVLLIAPYRPADSYLLRKLTGVDIQGARMAYKKPPLSEELVYQIETWIRQGAPRDVVK